MSLLDTEVLSTWLDQQGLEVGKTLTAEQLDGGRSNVMFTVSRGDSTWVLRRPALVAVARADDGMRREFRLLAALASTEVPHPRAVALCDDTSVLGCVFYLMQHVPGFHPQAASEYGMVRADVGAAMVTALAELHNVDWQSKGLTDFGRPEQFHERQVSRWSQQLASYEGRELPGIGLVQRWLDANLPQSFEPTIMHADFHVMNVLVAPDQPVRVAAILDWETATIGDPLLDLAGFLEVWQQGDAADNAEGSDLVERYAAARKLDDVADLTYYRVLYNFRLAVLLEGIYQRSLKDPTRENQIEMGDRALFNLARAIDYLG
jgi:aminoglycoside phosphotransferase (APT) family kinase protein